MGKMKLNYTEYLRYTEMEAVLREFSMEHPDFCRLYSIGKSHEGRDLWIMELTNQATGPADEKPGYYIDGNHHAGEVTGSAVCLYTVDYLLANYDHDETVTRLLDNMVFYILPRVSTDGAEFYLSTPHMLRSSVREWVWPQSDNLEGLVPEDIDGDGHILTMRVRDDESGDWKISDKDPRLMVRRGPDEHAGAFYRVYPEGRIRGFDGVEVRLAPGKWGLDFNRNYPMHWKPEVGQRGAGPYPFSEPETRAVGEFLLAHKNIAGALSYHTSGGFILRPLCTEYDQKMPMHDLHAIKAIGERGKEITGYPCTSIFEGFTYDRNRPSVGSFIDFTYDYLGILCFATELWDINSQAGLPKRTMQELIQLTDKQREEDGVKLLKWNDEVLGGTGFINWHPFTHPELSAVEIGGWLPKTVRQNPPTKLLPEECRKNMLFSLSHALTLPKLVLSKLEVEALAGNIHKVKAVVENTGYLPTSGSLKAEMNRIADPVKVEIVLPEGGKLLQGKAQVELGHIPGRSGTALGSKRKVEWTIALPEPGVVIIQASAARAGTARLVTDVIGTRT